MSIETIRLSERAKQQLTQLKKHTGIKNWNVLCRWAFCLSLAESSIPPEEDIPSDSSVEMTWKVFGGPQQELYLAILKQRLKLNKITLDDNNVNRFFRLHLHRGISYLINKDIRTIADLCSLASTH